MVLQVPQKVTSLNTFFTHVALLPYHYLQYCQIIFVGISLGNRLALSSISCYRYVLQVELLSSSENISLKSCPDVLLNQLVAFFGIFFLFYLSWSFFFFLTAFLPRLYSITFSSAQRFPVLFGVLLLPKFRFYCYS